MREGRVLDDDGYDVNTKSERAAARRLDTDTRWQDVTEADIEHYQDAAHFFDAIGLRYYMPAFMTYALRHFDDNIYGIADAIVFALEVPIYDSKLNLDRYELITPNQAQAIGGFL